MGFLFGRGKANGMVGSASSDYSSFSITSILGSNERDTVGLLNYPSYEELQDKGNSCKGKPQMLPLSLIEVIAIDLVRRQV